MTVRRWLMIGLLILLCLVTCTAVPDPTPTPVQDVAEVATLVVERPSATPLPTLTTTPQPTPTTATPTLPLNPTTAPTVTTNTLLPLEIEPDVKATQEITQINNFKIERVFDFGGKRIYDAWGERLIISPNELWLATITANQANESRWEEVRLYKYETGQQLYMLQRTNSPPATYGAMAFSPDSRWLAVAGAGWEQMIWIWDVANGNLVQQFSFWGPVTDLAFSPDGKLLAAVSASEDPEEHGVGIIDMTTNSLVAQMKDIYGIGVTFLEKNGGHLLVGAEVYYHPDREVGDILFIWDYEADTISTVLSQYGSP